MEATRVAPAPDSERVFLVAADVPPNLSRLKPGERLRWARVPRSVVRVGYRKSAADYLPAARAVLDTPKGWDAEMALAQAAGVPKVDLAWPVARALAEKDRLGGPERGLHVLDADPRQPWERDEPWTVDGKWWQADGYVTVVSTRCVRLGRYYPPSGGGEDYEDGGLSEPRVVVLVSDGYCEYISGDFERVPRGTE